MEGYHHTDCLWVAGIKPTEQWVATVTPPSQGIQFRGLKEIEFQSFYVKLLRQVNVKTGI